MDSFAPIGPWLVTKDELDSSDNLNLWLRLNGETMQDSNTSDMIFNIPVLVSYISQFMTLLPGDIISTGMIKLWLPNVEFTFTKRFVI